jgi:hypothetical protein
VIDLAKMTKAAARKRCAEAATKCATVFVEADSFLTTAQFKTLLECRNKLMNLSKSLK